MSRIVSSSTLSTLRPRARLAARSFRRAMSSSQQDTTAGATQGGGKRIFAPGPSASASAATSTPQQAAQFQVGTLARHALAADPLAQFHAWFEAAQAAAVYVPETCCLATASLPSGAPSARFVYLKELDDRGFVVYSNWGTSRKAEDVGGNAQASLAFWWRELERQVRVEGAVERLTRAESQRYYATRARGSKIGAWASRQSQVLPPVHPRGGGGGGGDAPAAHDASHAATRPTSPPTAPSTAAAGAGPAEDDDDDGRAQLDAWVAETEARFADTPDADIPVPPFWGGVRIVPERVEFWQGRDSRLHDRFLYSRIVPGPGPGEGTGGENGETEGRKIDGEWRIERLSP